MLIKFAFVLFVNMFFLLSSSVRAEINNHIFGNNGDKIVEKIDSFFMKYPNEKRVIWHPEIMAKSKYALSIPKDGYLLSKKYLDFYDLYYLSQKIDNGLNLQSNKSKNIDIVISENNSNLILSQSISPDIKVGLFLKYKENNSFGLNLNKDVILTENALGNFGFERSIGEHSIFNARFVKLFNNENTEFYGNINHEFKSDIFNVGIGNTWFDIANQFDFTLGINEQGKKVESEIYATFGDENIKFEVGLNQIKNNSNMNMFFNLKFENTLSEENFVSNVIITSKESIFGLKKLSLKSFRKKNLDILWKKHMKNN